MNSNVTYQLIGDRGILVKCESKCASSKIKINFVNSEPNSHLIIGEGAELKIYQIIDGHATIDLSATNSDVLKIRVSKTVSPLKSWKCDELVIVKAQDGQYRIFPDATKVLDAISRLRIFKKETSIKVQTLEKRIKKLEGEVTTILGGYVTE